MTLPLEVIPFWFGSGLSAFLACFVKEAGFMLVPGVDQVPLYLSMSAVSFAVGIFRFQMLDVLRVAQGLVIDNIQAGVLSMPKP